MCRFTGWAATVAELRYNVLSRRWVTIAADRASRPGDLNPRRLPVQADLGRPCPFCPGNEEETPPALETYGPQGQWSVRVVPNLYPAFAGRGDLKVTGNGLFRHAPATGIHEVIILTPEHQASWADLSDTQASLLMAALRDRLEDHVNTPGLAYTQVIVNYGREAGASIEHPHGQLLGIPFVPGELLEEQASFSEYGPDGLLSDVLTAEEAARTRLVAADTRGVAICPYWSAAPYEMLIIPRRPAARLDQAAPADLASVGRMLRDVLRRLRDVVGDVAYNLVFHSAPHRSTTPFHWHVHVLPQTTTIAGFEQGTGVRINVVPPETAASQLAQG